MPDAAGNIRGIATTGKAGETIERIFGKKRYDCETCGDTGSVRVHSWEDYGVSFECESCPDCMCEECAERPHTHDINGMKVCEDCWERGMGID